MLRLTRRQFGGVILAAGHAGLLGARPAHAHDGAHRTIEIRGFAFVPKRIVVKAGDAVDWINNDLVPHTATARNGSWDTGPIGGKKTVSVRFPDPGTWSYYCIYHPNMTGEIIVE